MTIQVHIDDRFEVNGLAIHVFEPMGPGRIQIYKPDGWHEIVDWPQNSTMPGYPFNIPREAAGPLFAALGKLLGSVENPEQLRKDYDAERRRVDKFIESLIDSNWSRIAGRKT